MSDSNPVIELSPGQVVHLGRASAQTVDSFEVEVVSHSSGALTLKGPTDLAMLRHGSSVFIDPQIEGASLGWGIVGIHTLHGDHTVLPVESLRWEAGSATRAQRIPCSVRVIVTHVTEQDGERETKRTIGTLYNISETGLRMRVRTPHTVRTLAHVQVYFEEEPVIALVRIVRVVNGTECHSGGFEVGATFIKFLSGQEILTSFLHRHAESEESGSAEGGAEEAEPKEAVEPTEETPQKEEGAA